MLKLSAAKQNMSAVHIYNVYSAHIFTQTNFPFIIYLLMLLIFDFMAMVLLIPKQVGSTAFVFSGCNSSSTFGAFL
jgi:ABC-type methionine transport system permease subunit